MRMRFLTSALLFFATLWLARAQGWTAGDIAWSMWLASLVVGYVFIIFLIGFANPIARGLFSREASGKGLTLVRAGAVCVGLFTLGFFTLHFGMFHFVHAVFLNAFFPLYNPGTEEVIGDFQFTAYFAAALAEYWPFVIAAGLGQTRLFLEAWRGDTEAGFTAPYKAVIRNHLVIMALGFSTIIAPRLDVLAPLLLVYFFPWTEALELWRGAQKTREIKALK